MSRTRSPRAPVPGAAGALGRGAAVVALLAVALTVVTAGPARAHTGGGVEPTNYRVALASVPGPVSAQVGIGGQWIRLRLTDATAGTVAVRGYRGEPFLRISADGVRLNARSTGARDNPRLTSRGQQGGEGGSPDEPQWVTVAPTPSVTWHDDRTSTGTGTWRLPLRIDGEPAAISGTRSYVPPPTPWPWVSGLLVVAAVVAALGWRARWHWPAAVALVAAGLAMAAHLAGSALTPGPGSATSVWLSALFTGVLCWPIAAVAVVLAVGRREHAPFAVAVAGAVLAIVSGPDDLAVLWHSQLAFAWPAALERALVVVTVGIGAGLTVAGIRRLRRPGPAPADVASPATDMRP